MNLYVLVPEITMCLVALRAVWWFFSPEADQLDEQHCCENCSRD